MSEETFQLPGNGLMSGDWDLLLKTIKSEASQTFGEDQLLRIALIKDTSWEEILKLIPKGSLIKQFRRVR
jgi:hypothetical protein